MQRYMSISSDKHVPKGEGECMWQGRGKFACVFVGVGVSVYV